MFYVIFVVVLLLFWGVSFVRDRDFIVFTEHDVVARFVNIACSCSLSSKITTE